MKTKFFITGLALMALTMLVNAQDENTAQSQQQTNTPVVSGVYIDANNNGICDSFETYGRGSGHGRGAGSGLRGGRGAEATQAAIRQGVPQGQGCGFGPASARGNGPGQGRGTAPGGRIFVDANNNGVCDHFDDAPKEAPKK